MTVSFRNVCTAAVMSAAWFPVACSTADVEPPSAAAAIGVARSETAVTIENRAGGPLLNIRVTIEPAGMVSPFVAVIPALEAGAKRELPFLEFRDEQGQPFDPTSTRAKQVLVTASDPLTNRHSATAPWDQ